VAIFLAFHFGGLLHFFPIVDDFNVLLRTFPYNSPFGGVLQFLFVASHFGDMLGFFSSRPLC
jgi:hypothetical protein